MIYVALVSRCVIGAVFAASAFSKLRSRAAFREFAGWLNGLPVLPSGARRAAAVMLAAAEIAVVLFVALPWTVIVGLVFAAVLLIALTWGVAATVHAGVSAPCQCFGRSGAPLSSRHVVRNLALIMLAVAGVVAQAGASSAVHPAGLVASLGAAVVAVLVVLFMDDLAALMNEGAIDALPGRRHRPALVVQPGTHAASCQVGAPSW